MAGNLRAIAAELIGTFALVFIGAGAVCADAATGGKIGLLGTAAAAGLILAAMNALYADVSGGLFNPAVAAAWYAAGRLDLLKTVLYVTAQLLGAVLAADFLRAVLHSRPELVVATPFLGACGLAKGIGYKAGTLLEASASFLLVSAYAAETRRRERAVGPIILGMTLAACMVAVQPLTGAALNPARAFGPAVVTGYWTNGFVYWVGPIVGGVAAVWIYEYLNPEKKR